VLLVVAVGTQNASSLVAAYWQQPLKVKAALLRLIHWPRHMPPAMCLHAVEQLGRTRSFELSAGSNRQDSSEHRLHQCKSTS
jgi:hypothetical protein